MGRIFMFLKILKGYILNCYFFILYSCIQFKIFNKYFLFLELVKNSFFILGVKGRVGQLGSFWLCVNEEFWGFFNQLVFDVMLFEL